MHSKISIVNLMFYKGELLFYSYEILYVHVCTFISNFIFICLLCIYIYMLKLVNKATILFKHLFVMFYMLGLHSCIVTFNINIVYILYIKYKDHYDLICPKHLRGAFFLYFTLTLCIV